MKQWRVGAVLVTLAALIAIGIWQWRARTIDAPPALTNQDVTTNQGVTTEQDVAIRDAPISEALKIEQPIAASPVIEFYRDIKPILDQRCVVCHGGNDAPCQLKLDSSEGLLRGATHVRVHDNVRVNTAEPTRLFVDAHSIDTWREKKFFPVINENKPSSEKSAPINSSDSVLYRMLALKAEQPLPEGALPASLDTSQKRKAFCPDSETFARYAKERPLHGMPFGLPALTTDEFAKITRWLETGTAVTAQPPLSVAAQRASSDWERFLNRSDAKSQLMARYIYEHLFLADLYFEGSETREFFKLVRSRTSSGEPVDIIATRRPYDDPGVARFYYRLQPYRATIVAKTHLPYVLNTQRMQRWQQLFLQSDYSVNASPSYAVDVAANPFVAFDAIPVQSRYRFLLDDAQFFISTLIKGSAGGSQSALNVIDDQFWVLFVNPDVEAMVTADFLARESKNLRLPDELKNKSSMLAKWKQYSALQANYLAAKEKYLAEKFPSSTAVTLDSIWSGDGSNQDAALTVFRHADSASVVPGLIFPSPKTAWIIDYPMFERMVYLLAVGFDVYGEANHQVLTRLYMDSLRMEGEANFLQFLPKSTRDKTRNTWYEGVSVNSRDSAYRKASAYRRESGIHYRSKNSQREFFDLVQARLGSALSHHYDIDAANLSPALQSSLNKIAQLRGRSVANFPETILLRVIIRNEPDRIFTLIHNDARSNVSVLLSEQGRRRPERDTLSVVPGIVGAYPNAFWVVHEDDLARLARDLSAVRGVNGYRALAARFAVSRNGSKFWQEGDWALNTYRNLEPIEWGILDYSRYER